MTTTFEFKLPLSPNRAPEKCARDYLLSTCRQDIGYIERIYSCDVIESQAATDGNILFKFCACVTALLPKVGDELSGVVKQCTKNSGIILETGKLPVGIPMRFIPRDYLFDNDAFITDNESKICAGSIIRYQIVAVRYQLGGWKAIGKLLINSA